MNRPISSEPAAGVHRIAPKDIAESDGGPGTGYTNHSCHIVADSKKVPYRCNPIGSILYRSGFAIETSLP